jgi:hypothetical protein
MPDPSTELVTVAVNPPAEMPDIPLNTVAAIVRELAANLHPVKVVCARYKITEDQLNLLKENKYFQDAFKIAVTEWESIKSTKQRIALQAACGIEDRLPDVVARMGDKNEALSSVTGTLKVLADMAGVGGEKQKEQSTERVQITINLGADQIKIDKAITPIEGEAIEVSPLPEGSSNPGPLQSLPSPS